MDPGCTWLPHLGSLTPAEKDRRDRAVLDRALAMVDRNSNLDPLECPEGDGSHPVCENTPSANASGRKQRVGMTGDARQEE